MRDEDETDSSFYVVRTQRMDGVWPLLQKGKARIGWSYADRLDLRKLQEWREAGEELDEEEKEAWKEVSLVHEEARGR